MTRTHLLILQYNRTTYSSTGTSVDHNSHTNPLQSPMHRAFSQYQHRLYNMSNNITNLYTLLEKGYTILIVDIVLFVLLSMAHWTYNVIIIIMRLCRMYGTSARIIQLNVGMQYVKNHALWTLAYIITLPFIIIIIIIIQKKGNERLC